MADLRHTQFSRESAIESATTKARLAQLTADAAVMPDGGVIVSQQIIEVLNNLPILFLVERTLTMTGEFSADLGESPISEWINLRRKKLIYLVTLTLRYASGGSVVTENIYLANHAFNTYADEDPPNTEFIAVLRDEDIPPFKQELSETLYGLSIPSFGKIVINNADGQFDAKLPPNRVWEGGDVVVKLTGDRCDIGLENAITIFTGKIGKVTWSDNVISAEILSKAAALAKINIPNTTFEGPNGEDVIAPIAYGYVNNLTPYLKDPVELTYKVAGHAINAISAVYDNGVALTAGSQYSTNLASGEFTLNQSPSGVITCDVQGKSVLGVFSANRGDFIYDILLTYGELLPAEIDGGSFVGFKLDTIVAGDSGIYLDSERSILEIISDLLKPVLGYLYFSRTGAAFIGRFTLPTSSSVVSLSLDSREIFPQGDAESDSAAAGDVLIVSQVDKLFSKAVLLYDHNYTVQLASDLGQASPVDPDTESGQERISWLAQESLRTEIELTGATEGRNLYPTAEDMEPLESYFIEKADADAAAQYWLDVFGVQRFIISVRCTIAPLQTTLHNIIELDYLILDEDTGGKRNRWFTETKTRSVAYEENYGENIINMLLFI
jgi:hypothetical protein